MGTAQYSTSGPALIGTLPDGETLPAEVPLSIPVPSVQVALASPPDFVPTAPSGNGGSAAIMMERFSVQLATLRAAQQTIIDSLRAVTAGYTTLAQTTQNDVSAPGFFGQDATATVFVPASPTQYETQLPILTQNTFGVNGPTVETLPDMAIQYTARQSAPVMAQNLTGALTAVTSMIEAIGQFSDAITQAGDAYASADAASSMTP
jgi:hypothetical protein